MWPRKQGCSHNGLRVLHISLFCIEPYSKLDSQSYGFSSSYVWVWEVDHKEGWGLKNWCFWTVVLEKTIQNPLNYKIKPANLKGNQPWIFIGRTYAEAEAPILWPPDVKNQFIRKDPDAEKDWRQEKKGTSEDEVARWHHQLNGHESEQAPRDSVGQDRQVCCSSWGCKELNTTEQLNNSKVENLLHHLVPSHVIYSSPESEEPTRRSASLLVVEREKGNNLSRSLDFWKCYWYARPLNIHEAYLLPFIVCVPYQVLQHILCFIIIQSD